MFLKKTPVFTLTGEVRNPYCSSWRAADAENRHRRRDVAETQGLVALLDCDSRSRPVGTGKRAHKENTTQAEAQGKARACTRSRTAVRCMLINAPGYEALFI